jgi:hypothetical protein
MRCMSIGPAHRTAAGRVTVTVFASDRNQLIMSSGEVPDVPDDAVEPRNRIFTR